MNMFTPSVEEEEYDDCPHDEDEADQHQVPRVSQRVPGGHTYLWAHVSGEQHGGAPPPGHVASGPIHGSHVYASQMIFENVKIRSDFRKFRKF